MTPKEYLEIALGGNYNISTLTLSAWEDMLKSYSYIKIKESKAPEMLEILKKIRDRYKMQPDFEKEVDLLIKKATEL